FLCWLLGKTSKFPKNVRFTFTVRIENLALEIMEEIVAARYTRDRRSHLERVSLDLDKLRILLRICHRLKHLDQRAYEQAMRLLDEAGRMTGGWLKHQSHAAGGEAFQ
ncbi:MAG: diversity-generating retroelement protein Avd, partial [Candidatus Eisenbacteria bacterium]|nr:diversity-generating retroelement protein Avd [Candidatus Eisenbacteria bacterium]